MKRLTFIHNGNDLFLKHLYEPLREWFDVRSLKPQTPEEMAKAIEQTDIAWFEWCEEIVALASSAPMPCKTVCRLHSYETFMEWPGKVNYDNIDKMIFVSEFIRGRCVSKFNIPSDKTVLIHNGVDLDKFTIPKDKKYNKRIAIVGYINYKKGPMLLMQTLAAIHEYDPEFTFHHVGTFQDERVMTYIAHFLKNASFDIEFNDWTDDIPGFLTDKDFILNTSMAEGHPVSLIEAMACGLIPIIHRWPGAADLFDTWALFNTPMDAVKIVRDQNKAILFSVKVESRTRDACRARIIDRYSLDIQIAKIKDTLMEVLADD